MITIGEMQISGLLTMTVLSVMLVVSAPGRSIRRISFAKARWMMAGGTTLIALQFLLQHAFGFRQMGVTQAVCCNLLFFTPSTLLCSMAVLYVQRQGKVSWKEWLVSSSICALSAIILFGTVMLDGVPFKKESPALRMAEYVSSVLFVVMQSYIFTMQYKAYKRLELAVDEYYDRSRRDLFGWMGLSMKAMALLVFLVPVVIFMQGTPLVLFSVGFFFAISYSVISLYTYGVSKDVERVEESLTPSPSPKSEGSDYQNAEMNGENGENVECRTESVEFLRPSGSKRPSAERATTQDDNAAPTAVAARACSLSPSEATERNSTLNTLHSTLDKNSSLDRWISAGHYREHNLTLSIVARQMGVPQKQLQEWLRQSEYKKLAGLVATLRIKEAQRVLTEHPEWSVESVADYCGFNDRKYFHQVFQQYTGTTPAKYQAKNS